MTNDSETNKRGLSVSAKISLGFSIVLLLHISIAVLGHYGLNKARRDLESYDKLRLQLEKFDEVDRVVGALQRNVLLFAFTGYNGPEVRATELQARLRQLLDEAQAVDGTADQDAIHEMKNHLKTHGEIFEAVVVDRASRRRLVNEVLTRYGNDFEREMRQLPQEQVGTPTVAAVGAAFRAAERDAMRFVNAPDSMHVRTAKVHLAKAKKLLEELEIESSKSVRKAISDALATIKGYEAAVIQMVQVTRGYLHLVNVVLAGEATEFRRMAGEIRERQAGHVKDLATTMAKDSRRFQFASNLFSVVTIVLGILAAWFIGRNVAPPLNAIAATFDGLTTGQQCDSIPALERRDELGRLASAAQVFKDKAAETERLLQAAENSRAELNALNQQLAAQTELAEAMAKEARSASQAKSDFLARMSHELRTPLNAVIGFSDGMLERADRHPLNDHQKDRLGKISSSGRHLLSLINDVLDIAKVESGRCDSEISHFDLGDLAGEVAALAEGLLKDKPQVRFLLDLPEVPSTLDSDKEKVRQILINLVGNAVKFTPQGSITLRIQETAEEVLLQVEDTGIGIEEGETQRIFGKFYQVEGASRQSLQGTGLGLALCRAFANQLGGQLSATSVLDKGSIFTLSIPRKRNELVSFTADYGTIENDAPPVEVATP